MLRSWNTASGDFSHVRYAFNGFLGSDEDDTVTAGVPIFWVDYGGDDSFTSSRGYDAILMGGLTPAAITSAPMSRAFDDIEVDTVVLRGGEDTIVALGEDDKLLFEGDLATTGVEVLIFGSSSALLRLSYGASFENTARIVLPGDKTMTIGLRIGSATDLVTFDVDSFGVGYSEYNARIDAVLVGHTDRTNVGVFRPDQGA